MKFKFPFIIILLANIASFSASGTFTDPRDGKTYRIVKIGNQIWMAENLNYIIDGSACYDFKFGPYNNCKSGYGTLYEWEAAMNACPRGWHLPTNEEWDILYRFVDGSSAYRNNSIAGRHLKAKHGWNWVPDRGKSGNGLDTYGFAALPGGGFYIRTYNFQMIGDLGLWWSASEQNDYSVYIWTISYSTDYIYSIKDLSKNNLFSVRCLKD